MEQPVPPPPNPPSSVDSSPRSRHTDSWPENANYATAAQPPKLRLMCSYGGHIIPRPHDKSLCYIGGDTRIIVIDRHTSLSDLHTRLSKTLLNNQPFLLKYQLPNEDLDSLISIATDEDLENMIDEYDRLSESVKRRPGRLRLFLFPKAEGGSQLLVESSSIKSEEWFLDALNGKRNFSGSDRGFSESSSVNNLLGLDEDFTGKAVRKEGAVMMMKSGNQDLQSVPDSPMVETTSSFGSTSSSPSVVANLPPIKVRVEESVGGKGIEEQFQQMHVGNLPVKDEVAVGGGFVAGLPVVVGGDYSNRGVSDDERSDHSGYRLVHAQQQQQQVHLQQQLQAQQQQISQFQQKQQQQQNSTFDLHSPDSVSSEGSARNPLARNIYQEQQYIQIQPGNTPVTATNHQGELKNNGEQNIRNKVQMQQKPQVHEYMLPGQYDQNHPQLLQPQQFVHPGAQYIPAGAVPMPSYYQVYPPRQPQNPQQPMLDQQQYPVYYLPARQNPAYSMPNYSELAPSSHASQPQTPSSANMATTPPAAYKPEMAAGAYRTMTPQLVQIAASQQHQTQYVGLPQFHHPSQSMAQPSGGANPPYGYEYADPAQGQVYYTQAMPPQMAAQYQTMTSAPTIVLPEASATEKVRTSQP